MKKFFSLLVMFFSLALLPGAVPAFAASGIAALDYYDSDATYNKADITGDGTADQITISQSDSSIVLKVNSETIAKWDSEDEIVSFQIVTAGGKSFLEINTENYAKGITSCRLYTVKNNQLEKALDYSTLLNNKILTKGKFVCTDKGIDYITASKTSGNTIYLTASLYTKSLGYIKVSNLKLNYKSGKFALNKAAGTASFRIMNTTTGKVITKFTAKKKLTAYKAAGSSKSKFKVKKGKTFTIKKGAVVKKNLYIQIKYSGKTGWLKLGTSNFVKTGGQLIYG